MFLLLKIEAKLHIIYCILKVINKLKDLKQIGLGFIFIATHF